MKEGIIIPATGIEHVCICSLDKWVLKSWYQKTFGLESIFINGEETAFIRAADGAVLEFTDAETAGNQGAKNVNGFSHIAFSVEQFDGIEEKLKLMDILIEKTSGTPEDNTRMIFFRDPEGNMIQVVFRKNPLK